MRKPAGMSKIMLNTWAEIQTLYGIDLILILNYSIRLWYHTEAKIVVSS